MQHKNVTILCVREHGYKENTPSNYKVIHDFQELESIILDTSNSTFEVLNKEIRKLYLDIEKIPSDKPGLIDELILDFLI